MGAGLGQLRRVVLTVAGVLVLASCSPQAPTGEAPTTTAAPGTTAAPATTAAPEAVFEDGDVITLIVPYSPGGGVDTGARVMAPHIERVLQEQTGTSVRVVVQNVEGASGRVGVDTVSRADPDGLTIGVLLASPMAGAQVTIGTPFDLRDLTYFAQYEVSDRAWVVRQDLELSERTVEGLVLRSQETPVLLGMAAGRADLLLLESLLGEEGMEFQVEEVEYTGTSDAALGLLRGDVEALWGHNPVGMEPFVADNPEELEFLGTTACARSLEDVPTIVDQGLPNAQAICEAVGGTRRVVYGPSGLPEPVVATYREALEAVLTDPAVVAELAEVGVSVGYQDAPEVTEGVANLLATYEQYSDILNEG